MNRIRRNNIHYLLKTSLELANEAIYLIDSNGKIIFANATACTVLGYMRKEVLKLNVWDIDGIVSTKKEFLSKLKLIKEYDPETPIKIQSTHRKKDGTYMPVEISSRVVLINNKEHIISYVTDITDKVNQDEKLNLYFEFIKESNEIIILVDFETQKIEFANQEACLVLGYTLEEFKQMRISQIRKAIGDNAQIPGVFKEISQTKNLITLGQYICKDGSSVFVETSLSLKNFQGKDYILAFSRDISDRLELEKRREEVNTKLANYNKTLKDEVSKIKKELVEYEDIMHRQSKMAAMGEMLENIAHQWRQPLSVISVLSTGMQINHESDNLDSVTLSNGLNDINTSAQYLSKTIDDFRDFFKPNYNKSTFPIREVVEYTVNLVKTKFASLHIVIVENIMDLDVYTFKNELIQVIINILNNAGDELIESKNKRKLIFIEAYTNDNSIFIKIKDNAGGIPPHILNRIFEPYFTTKHKSQGTGIGLFMSNEIIKKHMKGDIIVKNREFMYEDALYKGAEFIIKLPHQ
ncbi:PAS domain-containing sensor histidine kinase [Poseidonibacter lekithochrous]|uniref:PAS domain-containing sensor histidine kinase n=1 Tax=Poseidonibacter lekithochrous TaxID=1904463 RepID=UPI000D36DFE0|nr:PAS domain-containing sensor histidine kinase [Poseidonibacter lekithochrous]